MLRSALVVTLLLGLACEAGPAPESAPPAPAPPAPSPAPSPSAVAPLAGLTDADLCAGTVAQLLLKYDLEALQGGKCGEVCCAVDAEHWCCEMDFPFNDVPPCDEWGKIRNELFARHGYPFKEQRWRDEFEDEPWYRRREDFDSAWLSPVVAKNVATLKSYEEQKHACMP